MPAISRDAFLYTGAAAISRLPVYCFLPLFLAHFSTEIIGVLVSAWIFIDLLQAVSGLWMQKSFGRFFPLARSLSDRQAFLGTAVISSVFSGTGVFVIAYIILQLGVIPLSGESFEGGMGNLVWAIPLTAFLGNLKGIFESYLKVESRIRVLFYLYTIGAVTETIGILGIWYFGILTVESLILVESLKFFMMNILGFWGARTDLAWKFSLSPIHSMFKFGVWLLPAGIFGWVLHSIDRLWLGHLTGMSALGIYGIFYKLSVPLAVLFSAYITSLENRLYRMDISKGFYLLGRITSRYISLGGLVALAFSLFSTVLVYILMEDLKLIPQEYFPGLMLIPMFSWIIYQFHLIEHYGTGLSLEFQSVSRLMILIISSLFNLFVTPVAILFCTEYGFNPMLGAVLITMAALGISHVFHHLVLPMRFSLRARLFYAGISLLLYLHALNMSVIT